MPDDRPTDQAPDAASWLRSVHALLGTSAGAALTPGEQAALLDLARIAAHRSERIAAPLTTFLAGVAYGSLGPDDRVRALRALADRLED